MLRPSGVKPKPMNRPGVLLLSVLAVVLVGAPTSLAGRDIRVKLIEGRSGKPMNQQLVELYLGDPASGPAPTIKARTGSDGVARFTVADSTTTVWIYVDNGRILPCARQEPLSVDRILNEGIAEENRCPHRGKAANFPRASPGEVIVFVRNRTFWERIQT